jgi:hypothetical protein
MGPTAPKYPNFLPLRGAEMLRETFLVPTGHPQMAALGPRKKSVTRDNFGAARHGKALRIGYAQGRKRHIQWAGPCLGSHGQALQVGPL